ncbi:ABC transporter permease subunit [Escherichia coli]|uniref:ABC transporter permease subunit n=1 Tax=Escherichia coli TaxID=562 RepID=UPI0010CBD7F0|nr:hypothetical protein [Escherichia coli]GCR65549.1 sugar ABC transporter permease [Escherichia coli]
MSASSLPLPQGKSVSLKQFVSRHINEIGLLVVIAILYLVFSLNAPGFISLNNQMNVLRDAATIGIAAWAMTLIIISGEIDVSVGPMVAFVSVCLAFLLQFEVPLAIACLLVLLLGALMGTLAGVLRGVFNVPSFVATLGLWSALRGMGLFMTNALPVPINENEVLDWLGGQFLGVPVSALIMMVLFALFVFISRKTAFGRSVFAVGGNAAGRLLALQSTADWGRVVYIGETGKVEFEVSADLMHHQRRIIGSWVTSLFHMEKCAHDLTDWKLWPRNAITHRFSLEQAGDAYALMASGKCGKVVINFPD